MSKIEQLVKSYKPEERSNRVALNTFLKDGLQPTPQQPAKPKPEKTDKTDKAKADSL